MSLKPIELGLERLCADRSLLRGMRIGLVAHPASVDTAGAHAALRLRKVFGKKVTALFGPEHGFYGRGGAGEEIGHARHAAWDILIYSLYGDQRKPTPEMLADVDALVFDLQDIAVRCYTFVTSLRYVMEACAEAGKLLVVCDRPVPLPNVAEGPLPEPAFESFVAGVPVPLVYGMTSAEAARFLQPVICPSLKLKVIPMRGYRRSAKQPAMSWISPSPGIRYWETAWTYPITVFTEALPALDCGRGGTEPFQTLTAPFFDAEPLARSLNGLRLPGLSFIPYWNRQPGVRLQVTDPDALRPWSATMRILSVIQRLYGLERLWSASGTRPEWFDTLMGSDQPRIALQEGRNLLAIEKKTEARLATFRAAREKALLY